MLVVLIDHPPSMGSPKTKSNNIRYTVKKACFHGPSVEGNSWTKIKKD
jgi:hypothetical protein